MRKRISLKRVLTVLVAASAWSCTSLHTPGPPQIHPHPTPAARARPQATVRVRVADHGRLRIVQLPLEQYIVGCVRAELPPWWLTSDAVARMLRVQAIVSRTYAAANRGRHRAEGFDFCDTTHCQLYRGPSSQPADDAARNATADTARQVVTFRGKPIQALFHSNCGGHTAAAGAVWGGPSEPYLRGVDDGFCAQVNSVSWIFAIDRARLAAALNRDSRTRIGNRLDRIDIVEHDPVGRAITIAAVGSRSPIVRSEEFREVVRKAFGAHSLRSTWFTIERRGDRFVFEGVGYGHGVGLCQTGAALRAQAAQSPAGILQHYFPGTAITSQAQGN